MQISKSLARACRDSEAAASWLEQLPTRIRELRDKWELSLGDVFMGEDVRCSWVTRALQKDGTSVVLKLGLPHMEALHELQGLRFWDGDPTVRLLNADTERNAMLLESCVPGTSLRAEAESVQDTVLAGLLRRLWRKPTKPHPFRPLSVMIEYWVQETRMKESLWQDPGLVEAGLEAFSELSASSRDDVLLATDLHAGNVLRAQRASWLLIDPKPFVGDRAYDVTQHLFNCMESFSPAPRQRIRHLAELLELDAYRIALWMFARLAAEPRANWTEDAARLARTLV